MNHLTCAICDHTGPDVRVGLVRWSDGRCDAIPHCTDHVACRSRTVGDWPLAELEPA